MNIVLSLLSYFQVMDFSFIQHYLTEEYAFEVIVFCVVENILLFALALIAGRIFEGSWVKFTSKEKQIATFVVLINSLITISGFYLYLNNIIAFKPVESVLQVISEIFLILFGMDFLMFVFHYIAHKWKFMYRFHKLHHQHIDTRLESLFILHPIETIGFGLIWLVFISFFQFSFLAVIIYLALNFIWGLIGHYSKEVIPSRFWISAILTNSAFHHKHHHNEEANYGFYFTIWDKVYDKIFLKNKD